MELLHDDVSMRLRWYLIEKVWYGLGKELIVYEKYWVQDEVSRGLSG